MKAGTFVRRLINGAVVCAMLLGTAFAQSSSRDQLRFIVQQLCLKHWRVTGDPAPCIHLTADAGGSDPRAFAVLADRKGGAHLLLIPVATISGIESQEVRAPGAFNFFEAAWRARDGLSDTIGYTPPRAAVGLAVNPVHGRSQDQLHIHIACLNPAVYAALQADGAKLGTGWSVLGIGAARYEALRIEGSELDQHNPFELLARHLVHADDATMGRYTLLVAGASLREGPGFVLLTGLHVPPAELLLDGSCAVLHNSPSNSAHPTVLQR
jgi:CDP-diacylglycerol pyrophosphatase